MTPSKFHGGDTVALADRAVGTVVATRFSLVGKETEYEVEVPGERDSRRLKAADMSLVAHRPHKYQPSPSRSCAICGVRKRDHKERGGQ